MPIFLVERYLPGRDRDWLEAALARLATEQATAEYLGSSYVPSDDSCFCRFEAESIEEVQEANRRAGVPFARVVPAEELGSAQGQSDEGEES